MVMWIVKVKVYESNLGCTDLTAYNCVRDAVQPMVEKPWLYIIGRSQSSVAHQLVYVGERVTDLRTMTEPLHYKGRTYKDVVRFYSGK